MKLANNMIVHTEYAVGLRGSEGHPLSEAAADTPEQRAEHFPFDATKDGALVQAALAAAARVAA